MNGYRYSLEDADAIRDELKYAIPCRTCGAREPVRVEMVDGIERCSECYDGWPRDPNGGWSDVMAMWKPGGIFAPKAPAVCAVCHRTLTPEEDDAAITVNLGGQIGTLCSYCQDRNHQPDPEGDEE